MERVDWKKAYTEFLDGDQKNPEEMITKLSNTQKEMKNYLVLVDAVKVRVSTELEEIDEAINFINKK